MSTIRTGDRRKTQLLGLVVMVIIFMIGFNYNFKKGYYPDKMYLETGKTYRPYISQNTIHKQLNETLAAMETDVNANGNDLPLCTRHTFYLEQIHTRFTAIPKSGNSNWREALLIATKDVQNHGTNRYEIGQNHHAANKYRLDNLKLSLNSTAMSDAFTFTVMRNPWTRMVSGYKDKLTTSTGRPFTSIRMEIVREARGITNETELTNLYPTFKEFVRWLIAHEGKVNPHFMPQTIIMCPGLVTYDYIVPLECGEEYSREIWDIIQVNTSLSKSYDGNNATTQTSTIEAREWFSVFSADVIDKLYYIFRYDFSVMNYSNFTDKNFPYPLL